MCSQIGARQVSTYLSAYIPLVHSKVLLMMMDDDVLFVGSESSPDELTKGGSTIVEDMGDTEDEEGEGSGAGSVQFVQKLFELVSQESDGIVGFLLDGASFEVSFKM
jgi:hypothetical protein